MFDGTDERFTPNSRRLNEPLSAPFSGTSNGADWRWGGGACEPNTRAFEALGRDDRHTRSPNYVAMFFLSVFLTFNKAISIFSTPNIHTEKLNN